MVDDEHTIRPLVSDQFVAYFEGYDATGKVHQSIVRFDTTGHASVPEEFQELWNTGKLLGYQMTVGSYFRTDDEKIGLYASASTTVGRYVSISGEYEGKDIHFVAA